MGDAIRFPFDPGLFDEAHAKTTCTFPGTTEPCVLGNGGPGLASGDRSHGSVRSRPTCLYPGATGTIEPTQKRVSVRYQGPGTPATSGAPRKARRDHKKAVPPPAKREHGPVGPEFGKTSPSYTPGVSSPGSGCLPIAHHSRRSPAAGWEECAADRPAQR